MLTKGIKLKKGSLTVSSQSRRRLSKEAKGKGIARPLDIGAPTGKMRFPSSMDRERALVMDMYSDDFDFKRGLASRATKVKAPALAQPQGTPSLYGSFVKPEKMENREEAGKNLVQPGGMKRTQCPSSTEEGPLSSSSCVTASPVLEPRQLSFEDSLSDRDGDVLQGTASGPCNLRTKRIVAFRCNRVEDCRPTSDKHPGNCKQKKLDKVKTSFDCDKAVQHPNQRKRK
ncbi:hypothetical protein RHGRI_005104 [Rhododendron griersonianum]|uniref:Uncharacterized protein n=1 Tax=Rhododendron griersonianum TaxID=479676 RepID=A0AAV6LBT8_9ERIC|nr:hypothetical protein RHGRI_005104 [Rhododendron griersonianum]